MSDTTLATAEPSVGNMLAEFIQRGITAENVAAFTQLVELKERMDAKGAEREFAAAFVGLQGETSKVVATRKVDEKADGSFRYKFAAYEDIMAMVQPLLTRHGFSVAFDTQVGDTRLVSICTLLHKGGHARQNSFAVRYTKPPGSSDAQGDMSTKSYAKRGALCDALNITIDKDDDARLEGGPISADEAKELHRRVRAVAGDEAKFLKLAGAAHFEAIPSGKMDVLLDFLERKEKQCLNPDGTFKF